MFWHHAGRDVEHFDIGQILYKRLRIEGSTLRSRSAEYQANLIAGYVSGNPSFVTRNRPDRNAPPVWSYVALRRTSLAASLAAVVLVKFERMSIKHSRWKTYRRRIALWKRIKTCKP